MRTLDLIPLKYAQAIVESYKDNLSQLVSELSVLKEILTDDVIKFFKNEAVVKSRRMKVLDEALSNAEISQKTKLLFLTALKNNRPDFFIKIIENASALISNILNEKNALVKTAFELSDDEIEKIKKYIADKFKIHPKVKIEIDKELIAGVKIYVGNYILDSSAKGQLERLAVKF